MVVPLATEQFTVVPLTAGDLADVPDQGLAVGPYPGHSAPITRTYGPVGDALGQLASWRLQLDPRLWPVTTRHQVRDQDGHTYRVFEAYRRTGASGALDHVVVLANRYDP